MYQFYTDDQLRTEIAKADKFIDFLRDQIKKIPDTEDKKAFLELETSVSYLDKIVEWVEQQSTKGVEKRRMEALKRRKRSDKKLGESKAAAVLKEKKGKK